jgi:hypothetical protein
LSDASTRLSFQQIQVTLDQNGRHYVGAGVYHSFSDDGANLTPFTLVSFTLESASGRSYFFQGRIAPVNSLHGGGHLLPDRRAAGNGHVADPDVVAVAARGQQHSGAC